MGAALGAARARTDVRLQRGRPTGPNRRERPWIARTSESRRTRPTGERDRARAASGWRRRRRSRSSSPQRAAPGRWAATRSARASSSATRSTPATSRTGASAPRTSATARSRPTTWPATASPPSEIKNLSLTGFDIYPNSITGGNIKESTLGKVPNADKLDGLGSGQFWQLGGNGGTGNANFLGTTDNQPLKLKVDGDRALRIEPTSKQPNLIGGYSRNSVTAGAVGATIGGGGAPENEVFLRGPQVVTDHYGSIGGGVGNRAGDGDDDATSAVGATVGGGRFNTANATDGTVAGGILGSAGAEYSTVGGGYSNAANGRESVIAGGYSNDTEGDQAAVGGGNNNIARATTSTVAGGDHNETWGTDSIIAGGERNEIHADRGAVLGGDNNSVFNPGNAATIGGGHANQTKGEFATVAGGRGNHAEGSHSTVAGGGINHATGSHATIGGGGSNTASGGSATIAGGVDNQASDQYATIPGGRNNVAAGTASMAAGNHAQAQYSGSFVWGDNSTGDDVSDTAPNQFVARADGGYTFYTRYDQSSGAHLAQGSGSWSSLSDRHAKTAIEPVRLGRVLAKLRSMPVRSWQYKSQKAGVRHMGPMAQAFHRAFGLGESPRYISDVDAQGVALAGSRRWRRRSDSQRQRLHRLRRPRASASTPSSARSNG